MADLLGWVRAHEMCVMRPAPPVGVRPLMREKRRWGKLARTFSTAMTRRK
ncbi:hypothetical protein [Chenggangzhangella methanolivorans]|uniref:Uncharacterized protein n=1 Tax=Chenggangzhangella methanolivorans TaxID=1437009 RepID=A0A9E6UPE4_9HYPH|nr:hypothetical protein [Chenggangzhangella methanolivorans]QZN99659.1 hypothetical protein K6K41_23695 [Chenggangzhangella methanolivorans]